MRNNKLNIQNNTMTIMLYISVPAAESLCVSSHSVTLTVWLAVSGCVNSSVFMTLTKNTNCTVKGCSFVVLFYDCEVYCNCLALTAHTFSDLTLWDIMYDAESFSPVQFVSSDQSLQSLSPSQRQLLRMQTPRAHVNSSGPHWWESEKYIKVLNNVADLN